MTDNYTNELERLEHLLAVEKENHLKTKIKLKARERELHTITQSASYKLAKQLALAKHGLRIAKSYVRAASPKRLNMNIKNRRNVLRAYNSTAFTGAFDIAPTSKLAVVLHLYYPELLPYFVEKLERLSAVDYDLFVTLPEQKAASLADIKNALPRAHIALVPNCGRDVLPFVETARQLNRHGYTEVLKVHSKKSPHRKDGDEWRDKIVDKLIPKSKELQEHILQTLQNKNTAMIGPEGEYVSLLVNYGATGHHTHQLMTKLFDKKLAKELVSVADEYGFFAGTMFWSRIDALMPIIDNVHATDFEVELGQEDSTLAHALERLFAVVPELGDKAMFELTDKKLKEINYHTTNIPKWSEVALDD